MLHCNKSYKKHKNCILSVLSFNLLPIFSMQPCVLFLASICRGCGLIHYHTIPGSNNPHVITFENTVGKGENAAN